jgi:hypothetical protein
MTKVAVILRRNGTIARKLTVTWSSDRWDNDLDDLRHDYKLSNAIKEAIENWQLEIGDQIHIEEEGQ